MSDARTIEVLTKALEEIRDRSNKVFQTDDATVRQMLVDNHNTANIALLAVEKSK